MLLVTQRVSVSSTSISSTSWTLHRRIRSACTRKSSSGARNLAGRYALSKDDIFPLRNGAFLVMNNLKTQSRLVWFVLETVSSEIPHFLSTHLQLLERLVARHRVGVMLRFTRSECLVGNVRTVNGCVEKNARSHVVSL